MFKNAGPSRNTPVKAKLREVANLHLVNFIIAHRRATSAIGWYSTEARLSDLPHAGNAHALALL